MKKILCVLLCLSLLLPVLSFAEEDLEITEITESVLLDDENNETILDEETGEVFVFSDSEQEVLDELDEAIDDSVDPDTLELNENCPSNIVNILLCGVDVKLPLELDDSGKVIKKNIEGRADTQIIVSVNMDTGEIKMISILRDSYVPIPGYQNKDRINTSFAKGCNRIAANPNDPDAKTRGGAKQAMRTVNHLFALNIQYCVAVNFAGLAAIIEAIGGIDIDMTRAEATAVNSYLKKAYSKPSQYVYDPKYNPKTRTADRVPLENRAGIQHCDGIQALIYARLRSLNNENDFNRTDRQRHLLDLLLKKVLDNMDLNSLTALLKICIQYAYTNINMSTFVDLGTAVLSSGLQNSLNGEDALFTQLRIPMAKSYSYKQVNGNSVISYNIKKHARAIHEFIYGDYYPVTED